jgi:histidinol-phosphate aminotransferase
MNTHLPPVKNPSPTPATCVTRTIRPDVLAMHRYTVQPAAGMVKLDAMENPYPLPPTLAAQLGQVLANVALNRYPAGHTNTQAALRTALGIPADLDIMLGNGSDELIHLIIQACATGRAHTAEKPAVIMAPLPGFVMYAMSTVLNRCTFVGVPLQADFSLDMPAMLAAIALHQPAVLFIAYPNNPTGNAWALGDIAACITAMQAHGGLVVMDEAYQPFAADSWLARLQTAPNRADNVILVRTLSKLGLAGLRLGYLVAAPQWVEQFDKVRPPYNINVLTLAATDFLLAHIGVFNAQAAQLKAQRTVLFSALTAMKGVHPFPSEANFVLAKVPNAAAWFDALKAQGILIKNVSAMSPLLADCLRLTVGSEVENARLIKALQALAHG